MEDNKNCKPIFLANFLAAGLLLCQWGSVFGSNLASSNPESKNIVIVVSGGFASCGQNNFRNPRENKLYWALNKIYQRYAADQNANIYRALACFSGYLNLREDLFYAKNFLHLHSPKGYSYTYKSIHRRDFSHASQIVMNDIENPSLPTHYVIAGHSYGGTVALMMAKHFSEREHSSSVSLVTLDPIDPMYCNAGRVVFTNQSSSAGCKMAPPRLFYNNLASNLWNRLNSWVQIYQTQTKRLHSGRVGLPSLSYESGGGELHVFFPRTANKDAHSLLRKNGSINSIWESFLENVDNTIYSFDENSLEES